jgi:hypothetical protein
MFSAHPAQDRPWPSTAPHQGPARWQEVCNDPDNEALIITGTQWLGTPETVDADSAPPH